MDGLAKTAPGPRGSLLFGSLKEFQSDSIGFMTDSVQQYGDIVRFRFGYVVAYLVNRPEYVEQVLVRGSKNYDKNTRSVAKLRATCGNSLLSSDGQPWLRHRRLMQPMFQPQSLAAFAPAIESSTRAWIDQWDAKADGDESIDVVSEMMGLTLTIAAEVLFESDLRDQTAVIEQALQVILADTWRRLESPIDLALISKCFHRPAFRRALGQIDQTVYRIIDQRRRDNTQRDDLLSRLLRAHEVDVRTRFSDQELRDAVITLLLAGHETTANALASACFLISKSPQTQERLAREGGQIASNAGGDDTTTKNAFLETIRLYPSIWIIERRALIDDRIDGFSIPKGATVILSPYLLHRHRDYWLDPDRFDPDRFHRDRSTNRPRCSYLPFGLGPHRCIGESMALLVATTVLSCVNQRYRLCALPGHELRFVPGITLRHAAPLPMKIQRVDQRAVPNRPNPSTRDEGS